MNCKSILKKKIPLNFIATSTQKQLHEIKLRKKKKLNKFLQMQSKKSQKKSDTQRNTHYHSIVKKKPGYVRSIP